MASQLFPTYGNERKLQRLQKNFDMKYLRRYLNIRYRTVGSVHLSNGLWISTVCLMTNYAFRFPAVPVIFETLVFAPVEDRCDMDGERYCTLHEAREGHRRFVQKYKKYKLNKSQ